MRALRAACAAAFFSFAAHAAVPAHYLVFTVGRDGEVKLFSQREVMLAEAPGGDAIGDDDVAGERLTIDAGAFHKNVPVDRFTFAEWPDANGEMQRHRIELEEAAVVVRVPVDAGESLLVEHSSGRTLRMNLPRVARALAFAPDPLDNRLDLLIMGDGYTASQAADFERDAAKLAGAFFDIPPYADYKNFMRTASLFTPSNQSGADHPNCPTDPDPRGGAFVDTAFDATYCTAGLQRLVTVNVAKVFAAAAAAPNWDKIFVLVNDTAYGGSGGSVLVGSLDGSSVNVIQHEFGHTFTGLADEYSSPYPGYPTCSDRMFSGCEPNVTDQNVRASIKWGNWIAPATSVPTPDSDLTHVGLFVGARYMPSGMFRPKSDCLMNHLGVPFCEICKQAFITKLYGGWGGVPAAGVSPIEPGETPSASMFVGTVAGKPITFNVTLMPQATSVIWKVDGVVQPGAAGPTFTYSPAAGSHTVSITATDTTPAVKDAATLLARSRTWSVVATPAVIPPRRHAAPH